MTLRSSARSTGRRLAVLVVLVAVGLAVSLSVRANEASAHGQCYADGGIPFVDSGYFKGWGSARCEYQHDRMRSCGRLQKRDSNGVFQYVNTVVFCDESNNSASTIYNWDSKGCGWGSSTISGTWRMKGKAEAWNNQNELVHVQTGAGSPKFLAC